MGRNYEQHRFFCIRCGKEGIPILRQVNHKHSKHHRKKLWCPTCKMEINFVECRNDQEIQEFKENFEQGNYQTEVEESLKTIQQDTINWS